jgi:hypothetical protein
MVSFIYKCRAPSPCPTGERQVGCVLPLATRRREVSLTPQVGEVSLLTSAATGSVGKQSRDVIWLAHQVSRGQPRPVKPLGMLRVIGIGELDPIRALRRGV